MTIDDVAKLLDEKLKGVVGDIDAMGVRMRSIERKMPDKMEYLQILNELGQLEKRYTEMQGKVDKTATKEDLVRIEKKLDLAGRNIDDLSELFKDMADAIVIRKEFVGLEKRVERVEGRLELAV